MIVVSAGTWIHRGNQHKTGRVVDGYLRSRYGNFPLLQRLTHDLEYRALELGQFIQEQHTVMSEGDFTGLRVGTSADHGGVADGMVRRAERTDGHERLH